MRASVHNIILKLIPSDFQGLLKKNECEHSKNHKQRKTRGHQTISSVEQISTHGMYTV